MARAAEQFASSLNFGAFSKATELKQRLWFTLGALIVYRLGTFIPIPGIDPVVVDDIFTQQAGGILGVFDSFAGGALSRMSIFALNVIPYISAAIIMQLLTAIMPSMEALKKEGEAGRKKINQYTRYLTVFLATIQAFGLSRGLEGLVSSQGPAVHNPGLFFQASTVITIVGGTMFLMWLGEQITARGVGNGISLIIFPESWRVSRQISRRCSNWAVPVRCRRYSSSGSWYSRSPSSLSLCISSAPSAESSCSIPSVRSVIGCSVGNRRISR